jgi:hypothetical protein
MLAGCSKMFMCKAPDMLGSEAYFRSMSQRGRMRAIPLAARQMEVLQQPAKGGEDGYFGRLSQ